MPIVKARLKDGREVLVADLIEGKIENPGFPISYIRAATEDRPWDGSPHVTALLNGTRETFLKYVSKYTVDLDGMTIPMAGTKFHSNMENPVDITEIHLSFYGIQGISDLLDVHPQTGELSIVDYKLVGSFALKKWLGIVSTLVPEMDDFGNPVYLKSGRNKGSQKMKKEIVMDPTKADRFNYTMQVNIYRVLLEAVLNSAETIEKFPKLKPHFGKKVSKLQIFYVLRDGNLNHDFSFNSYLEDAEIYPDEKVVNFIEMRATAIKMVMDKFESLSATEVNPFVAAKSVCPGLCSDDETWHGKKCESYCPVARACYAITPREGGPEWNQS